MHLFIYSGRKPLPVLYNIFFKHSICCTHYSSATPCATLPGCQTKSCSVSCDGLEVALVNLLTCLYLVLWICSICIFQTCARFKLYNLVFVFIILKCVANVMCKFTFYKLTLKRKYLNRLLKFTIEHSIMKLKIFQTLKHCMGMEPNHQPYKGSLTLNFSDCELCYTTNYILNNA